MNLKGLLLATVRAAAIPAMACAADLPLRSAPPAFVPPPPSFTWTGFYPGVNAGYDLGQKSRFMQSAATGPAGGVGIARPAFVSSTDDGAIDGGQIGYT